MERDDNDKHCYNCKNDKWNKKKSEKSFSDENRKKHTAADSKTPVNALPADMRSERVSNKSKKLNEVKRKNASLERKLKVAEKRLEDTKICMDGSKGTDFLREKDSPNEATTTTTTNNKPFDDADELSKNDHDNFMGSMKGVCKDIVKDKGKFEDIARTALVDLLKQGVNNEKKKNGYKFKEENVSELVTFLLEQITNMSKKLSGKSRNQNYSPLTFQLAYAMWSRSSAAYREMQQISPLLLPSERRLRDIKQQNKVRDGEDIKAYQLRAAARGIKKSEYGYLMCDEMKLKHGVLWNSQTGEAVGLADDMLDLSSVLKHLLSEEGDVVKPAVYVNQWRYISIGIDKCEGWMCGFFFNDGSLTGDTLLRRFDYVTLCCESIGAHVYGLVMDAGGNNAKFASRLRDNKSFSDETTVVLYQKHLGSKQKDILLVLHDSPSQSNEEPTPRQSTRRKQSFHGQVWQLLWLGIHNQTQSMSQRYEQ